MRTVTAVSIHRKTESPVYGEGATIVSLEDEAAGYFFKLTSNANGESIRIELEELREVCEAAKWLIEQAKQEAK